MSDLNKKVQNAIKILKIAEEDAAGREDKEISVPIYGGGGTDNQSVTIKNNIVELSYSGGKDSDVILILAKMAGIKFNAIYKNTTIDPSGTIAHAKENGAIVVKPKINFFDGIEKAGLPNRWSRWCCMFLKEYKVADVAIQGMRRDESTKRAKNYKEPNFCRAYSKTKKVSIWLPILEWTKDDVAEFVKAENIKCHSLYYDDDGKFHPERRLGCIGCLLASKNNRLQQLKAHPKFVREYVKRVKIFREGAVERRMRKKGLTLEEALDSFAGTKNEYESVFFDLFCDSRIIFEQKVNGLFGRLDCKQFLEDYFKIDLP